MQPRITNPEGGGPRESQTMAFMGGQQKSISPSENQGLLKKGSCKPLLQAENLETMFHSTTVAQTEIKKRVFRNC